MARHISSDEPSPQVTQRSHLAPTHSESPMEGHVLPGSHGPPPVRGRGDSTGPAYNRIVTLQTQNRSQRFRETRDQSSRSVAADRHRLLAERRARNAVYRTV